MLSKSICARCFGEFPHGVGTPGETEAWQKWGNVFLTLSLGWHVAFLPGHRVAVVATPAGLTP